MVKWLLSKFGVKGVQWFTRACSAATVGLAAYSVWLTGRQDGIVEIADKVNETLKNEK